MGNFAMIIRRKDWRTTKLGDKTRKKIWELAETQKISAIVRFGEAHAGEDDYRDFPFDRKTVGKVCRELYRIGLDDLPNLEPEVVYYLLKRRPELAGAAGLQMDEIEEIRTFTDKQWELAEIIATMPEIIPLDGIPSPDLNNNEDNIDTPILRRIISICRSD